MSSDFFIEKSLLQMGLDHFNLFKKFEVQDPNLISISFGQLSHLLNAENGYLGVVAAPQKTRK